MKPLTRRSSPALARASRAHCSQPCVQCDAMSGACTKSRQRVTSGQTLVCSLMSGMEPGASSGRTMVMPHRFLRTA